VPIFIGPQLTGSHIHAHGLIPQVTLLQTASHFDLGAAVLAIISRLAMRFSLSPVELRLSAMASSCSNANSG